MKQIASFQVDHDYIVPGVYISRIDGDIVTYDLRTRTPNAGDYMDNITMHSVEHLFATYARNSDVADKVIYFGPMGCQTGFYLLMRQTPQDVAAQFILDILRLCANHTGEMFGASRKECGNYQNLDTEKAKAECKAYLAYLEAHGCAFDYPTA